MNALKIIGTATAFGAAGTFVAAWIGAREGGDFNFAPAIYAPVGAVVGGFIGLVIGALAFAN